jgi:putative transposase
MIEPQSPKLSIVKQCRLLGLNRSTFYYKARPECAKTLEMMRLIDMEYMKRPFYGARKMRDCLHRKGYRASRGKVRRLMKKMGIMAIYQKPRTTIPDQAHKKYPYLLRNLKIDRPNQVWCTDITYIPVERGFFYLVAVMDWYSRKVLSWRLSSTMDTQFCIEALEEAMEKYGQPEIFNTDQGSQFTSDAWIKVLKDAGIKISMDGKGRWMDNVFIERLWRSLKYECLFLHDWFSGAQVRTGFADWFHFYNTERPHHGLGGLTPDEVCAGYDRTDIYGLAEAA